MGRVSTQPASFLALSDQFNLAFYVKVDGQMGQTRYGNSLISILLTIAVVTSFADKGCNIYNFFTLKKIKDTYIALKCI